MNPESQLIDPHTQRAIKANGLSYLFGKDLQATKSAGPGDIVAVTRIDDLEVGDVLVSEGDAKRHEFPLPRPFFRWAVSPASRADEQKILGELAKAVREDPCVTVHRDPSTGENIVSGLSELHLATVLHRIEGRGVGVTTKLPRIAYKETITGAAEASHRHKKQTVAQVSSARRTSASLRVHAARASSSSTPSSAARFPGSTSRRSRKGSRSK